MGGVLVNRERRQAIGDDESAIKFPVQLLQMQARCGAQATPQIRPPQILGTIPHRGFDYDGI